MLTKWSWLCDLLHKSSWFMRTYTLGETHAVSLSQKLRIADSSLASVRNIYPTWFFVPRSGLDNACTCFVCAAIVSESLCIKLPCCYQKTILLYFLYYRVWWTLCSHIFSKGTPNEKRQNLFLHRRLWQSYFLDRAIFIQFLYLKTLRHKALLKTNSCKLVFLSQYVELNFMEVSRVVYRALWWSHLQFEFSLLCSSRFRYAL